METPNKRKADNNSGIVVEKRAKISSELKALFGGAQARKRTSLSAEDRSLEEEEEEEDDPGECDDEDADPDFDIMSEINQERKNLMSSLKATPKNDVKKITSVGTARRSLSPVSATKSLPVKDTSTKSNNVGPENIRNMVKNNVELISRGSAQDWVPTKEEARKVIIGIVDDFHNAGKSDKELLSLRLLLSEECPKWARKGHYGFGPGIRNWENDTIYHWMTTRSREKLGKDITNEPSPARERIDLYTLVINKAFGTKRKPILVLRQFDLWHRRFPLPRASWFTVRNALVASLFSTFSAIPKASQLLDLRSRLSETFPNWAKLGTYQLKEGTPKDFMYLSMLRRFLHLKDERESEDGKRNLLGEDEEKKKNLLSKLDAMEKAFLDKGRSATTSTSTKEDNTTVACESFRKEDVNDADSDEVEVINEMPSPVKTQPIPNEHLERPSKENKNNNDEQPLELEVENDYECDNHNNRMLGIKSAEEQNVKLTEELNQERAKYEESRIQLEAVKKMCENGNETNWKLSHELKAANNRADSLQEKLNSLQAEMKHLNEGNVEQSQKYETLSRTLSCQEELTQRLVQKYNGLLTQITSERETHAVQTTLLAKEKELNEALKENVKQLRTEVQSLSDKKEGLLSLKAENEKMKSALDSVEADFAKNKTALMKDMEKAMRDKMKAQDLCSRLELLVQKLEGFLLSKKKKVMCLKEEMKIMSEKFKNTYQTQHSIRKKEHIQAQERAKELALELDVLRGQLRDVKEKYEIQRGNSRALMDRNVALDQVIKEQAKTLEILNSEKRTREIEDTLVKIKKEPQDTETDTSCPTPSELDHVKRTLQEMRDKNAELVSKNASLKEQIERLKKYSKQ